MRAGAAVVGLVLLAYLALALGGGLAELVRLFN